MTLYLFLSAVLTLAEVVYDEGGGKQRPAAPRPSPPLLCVCLVQVHQNWVRGYCARVVSVCQLYELKYKPVKLYYYFFCWFYFNSIFIKYFGTNSTAL